MKNSAAGSRDYQSASRRFDVFRMFPFEGRAPSRDQWSSFRVTTPGWSYASSIFWAIMICMENPLFELCSIELVLWIACSYLFGYSYSLLSRNKPLIVWKSVKLKEINV